MKKKGMSEHICMEVCRDKDCNVKMVACMLEAVRQVFKEKESKKARDKIENVFKQVWKGADIRKIKKNCPFYLEHIIDSQEKL